MSAPSISQVPATAEVAPTEDCEPVFRWTKDSRIIRGCRS